jgi:hypothetical protein
LKEELKLKRLEEKYLNINKSDTLKWDLKTATLLDDVAYLLYLEAYRKSLKDKKKRQSLFYFTQLGLCVNNENYQNSYYIEAKNILRTIKIKRFRNNVTSR